MFGDVETSIGGTTQAATRKIWPATASGLVALEARERGLSVQAKPSSVCLVQQCLVRALYRLHVCTYSTYSAVHGQYIVRMYVLRMYVHTCNQCMSQGSPETVRPCKGSDRTCATTAATTVRRGIPSPYQRKQSETSATCKFPVPPEALPMEQRDGTADRSESQARFSSGAECVAAQPGRQVSSQVSSQLPRRHGMQLGLNCSIGTFQGWSGGVMSCRRGAFRCLLLSTTPYSGCRQRVPGTEYAMLVECKRLEEEGRRIDRPPTDEEEGRPLSQHR